MGIFKFYMSIALLGFLSTPPVSSDDSVLSHYEVLSSWKSLDFKFPSPQTRSKVLQIGQFIPENNVLAGIKVHGSRIYLTVPRLRNGVPSTLNYINIDSLRDSLDESPLLRPYPSWNMQRIGNCNALQFVQSMEIDRWGRMWIIDVGRENIQGLGRNNTHFNCPAKLILIDLATNQILHKHEFPSNVVNPLTNFLNDIVVECISDRWTCWAYMTDSWDSKLVLYSLEEDRSWFVRNPRSMEADPQATQLNILGANYNFNLSINGIALSPRSINHDRLYFTPLSSYSVYSVSTSTLKQVFRKGHSFLRDSEIVCHANNRPSQSGGIMMDSSGLLFTGQLQNNAVSYFNATFGSAAPQSTNQLFNEERLLIQDDRELQWPDTFAFDTHGYLYLVTCRMHRFFTSTLNFNDVNFRVVRVFVGSKSYMHQP